MIVPVKVYHKDSPRDAVMVYALLDNQATGTFITQNALDKLGTATTSSKCIKLGTLSGETIINCDVADRLLVCNPKNGEPIQLPGTHVRYSIPAILAGNSSAVATSCCTG